MLFGLSRCVRWCKARTSLSAATIGFLAFAAAVMLSSSAFAQRLKFEVASVKHTTNVGPFGSTPRRSGDRFTMHNAQLYTIIYYAYNLRGSYELVGDLGYGSDEWNSFDIDAVVGHDATEEQVRLMLQSLLADRFKLKLHRETREMPGYEVTVTNGGPKLTRSSERPLELLIEGRHFSQPKGTCSVTLWREGAHLSCHAATIQQILSSAGGELRAPVADHTRLTGTYDMNLLYMPDERNVRVDIDPEEATAPSLPQAFREQVGLKIAKGKVSIEVIVVDRFEKTPTAN